MYERLVKKMTNNFSKQGSIIYSEACDYSGIYPITKDDIKMYYSLLESEDKKEIPSNISITNHIACCLFYLSKESDDFKNLFKEKYLETMEFDNLQIKEENLVLIFNIIEFDKTYLHSPEENISFLYTLLKKFSNYGTDFEHYILYKYFRGYIKLCLKDYANTNKEYLEIIVEMGEKWKSNFFLKYIKLRNSLLKINLFNSSKMNNDSDFIEYLQFLKDLYDEVKEINKTLAFKFGLDLFSSYLEIKKYNNCIPLLVEMKKNLKKDLLKGTTMKNGIDFYLAIASRLGYIGILLDDKKAINSAIKKIKKSLDMIKKETQNTKLVNLTKEYNFILAILEVNLNKTTEYDLKKIASEFRNFFLPDLDNKSSYSHVITEENRENVIINFQIINNMNQEIASKAKNILIKKEEELSKINISNNIFLTFISAIHDKINFYSHSYISDNNERQRKLYKEKIKYYFQFFINIVYKIYEIESLLDTKFVKTMILEIFSSYAHIFIYEKNMSQLRTVINSIDDIKKKIQIENDLPAFGLINKIKGDYWFYQRDYKASITYYEQALNLFEKNEPKIAPVLFNNGCAHFFNGNKHSAIEYLNRSISEYNNILMQKNIFGFTPNVDKIKNIISSAKKLLSQLSD